MCLILFAFKSHPGYRLILAGNRDEFYDRPSAPAGFWEEDPAVLAGRDILAGGTWFGVTRTGRFAGITNYRDPRLLKKNAPSRGLLVSRYLMGGDSPFSYLDALKNDAERYNGFNIILGWRDEMFWYSNRCDEIQSLTPGIYGLSNHLLDTPWPKAVKGKAAFEGVISHAAMPGPEELFNVLHDRAQAPDKDLPDTGVGLERERMLSPAFISSPDYGTCSSTLLLIDRSDRATFIERAFNRDSRCISSVRFDFKIEPALSCQDL